MKALITGATGFVGPALVARCESPVALSRDALRAAAQLPGATCLSWPDPTAGPPPAEAFDGVDVVYHLAGEPAAEGRWTAAKKARILDRREQGTRHLVDALAAVDPRPKTRVCASAVGLNVVAPTPVTNREFTKALGRALHRPTLFPVPALALRLAFGELGTVVLDSQRVIPKVALAAGYTFAHADLDAALAHIVGAPSATA